MALTVEEERDLLRDLADQRGEFILALLQRIERLERQVRKEHGADERDP